MADMREWPVVKALLEMSSDIMNQTGGSVWVHIAFDGSMSEEFDVGLCSKGASVRIGLIRTADGFEFPVSVNGTYYDNHEQLAKLVCVAEIIEVLAKGRGQ